MKTIISEGEDKFEGTWLQSLKQGDGKETYANGDSYTG